MKKIILILALSTASTFAQAATGELWDVKMKMSGMEMEIPGQQVCMAKDKIREKDVQGDENCHTTSFKALGSNRVKFSFACKDGGTGDGDIERTAKTFKQTMNMVSEGKKTTMNSSGTNTGQACDPDAGKKKMEAAIAQSCEDSSKKMDAYQMFFPKQKDSVNCDKYKGAYCSTVKSIASGMTDSKVFAKNAYGEGYDAKTLEITGSWKDAVTACGAGNPDSIRKSACKNGVESGNYEMVNRSCPTEAAELKAQYQRECVGRNYTSNKRNPKYADFCSKYSNPGGGSSEIGEAEGSGASNTSDGKKKKGLLDVFKSKKEEPANGSAPSNNGGSNNGNTPSPSSPPSGNSTGGDVLDKAKKLKDVFGF